MYGKKLSETNILDLATKAANDFLNAPHKSLNDTISKLAQDNDLTPEETGRVVEAANKEVYLSVFPTLKSKVFEYKLAEIDEITKNLNKPLIQVESKSSSWKPITRTALQKTAAETLERIQSEVGTDKQILERELAKAELKKEALELKIEMTKSKLAETMCHFIKKAKELALDGDNLYAAGVILGRQYPEQADLIGKMLDQAIDSALLSKTAGPVNKNWINEAVAISGMPVQVINGKHALCYDIDLLIDQSRSIEGDQQGLWRVHDEVDFIRRNLKNVGGLETSKESSINQYRKK